jgi:hypothetical protein
MNTAYYPKPNSIEYPQIKVFVPYVNMQPATAISLIGYNYTPVFTDPKDDYSYSKYFKERWEKKETFITIEQDIVVYPRALEALWDCPKPWCVCDFHLPNHRLRNLETVDNGNYPMGCMKISKEMIEALPNYWGEDIHFSKVEWKFIPGLYPIHQHFPGVVNANPALLGFARMEENNG